MQTAITRFRRRIGDLEAFDPNTLQSRSDPRIRALEVAIDQALIETFGHDTPEYRNYSSAAFLDRAGLNLLHPTPLHEVVQGLIQGKEQAIALLNQAIRFFEEKLADHVGGNSAGQILRAYEGLDLHQEIARAASKLYRDGHYANAVEAAVKALNGLVRLRSGLEVDGITLMERAFSPSNPILKFNDLSDQSDRDEQKGFMMMFSGAVAGLRNPRAHGFIHDDPERALEFIAYVSLLAKLLDEATT